MVAADDNPRIDSPRTDSLRAGSLRTGSLEIDRGVTNLKARALDEMRGIMAAMDARDPARAAAARVAHVEKAAAVAMFIFESREAPS